MSVSSSSSPTRATFRGGLLKPPPRHMPTLFTLVIVWLLTTMTTLVFVPYMMTRHEDSWWSAGASIAFLTALCFVSTLHGALGYLMGYSRGGPVSNFFIGAFLLLPGLGIVALRNARRAEAPPPPPSGLLRKLDRLAYATGNIWFGIAQLTLMLVFLLMATVYESSQGGIGNEAAYASYYAHWSFGIIFIVFFVTLYCATLRKYPFRLSQTGWLCTHAGLLILMAGCLAMHWGGYSGWVTVTEGRSFAEVNSQGQRVLDVSAPTLAQKERVFLDADKDPAATDVEQEETLRFRRGSGEEEIALRIDRFYSRAEKYRGLEPVEGSPRAGVEWEVFTRMNPGQRSRVPVLEDSPRSTVDVFGQFTVSVMRASSRARLESLAHTYAPADARRGALVLRGEDGEELARLPVVPGARDEDPAAGAAVDARVTLPGGEVGVRVDRYFSQLTSTSEGELRDASPGSPLMPGISVVIEGAAGRESHSLRADGLWFNRETERPAETAYGVKLVYECTPSDPRPPGTIVTVFGPEDEVNVVVTDSSGRARIAPFVEDADYSFSPTIPLRVIAKRAIDGAEYVEEVRQRAGGRQQRALRVTASRGASIASEWVFELAASPTLLRLGDLPISLRYEPLETRLPFEVSLIDFRGIEYPNSTKPRRFEANVVVADEEMGLREARLVDMNHPLDHRGWRFFNSSMISQEGIRGVQFQVARNPGLPVILIGSTITTLGLILVFFFKPKLREIERRRAAAQFVESVPESPAAAPRGA